MINLVSVLKSGDGAGSGSRDYFAGEIHGLKTVVTQAGAGEVLTLPPLPAHVARIVFVAAGEGVVAAMGESLGVTEPTVMVLPPGAPCTVQPTTPMTLFELHWMLRSDESVELANAATAARFPYFKAYSAATSYKEAIKSPKTVSRTLVPHDLLPRFAMGSVQTSGPDVVGRHSHPMLEQLFFGLPGSEQTVLADEEAAVMREYDLLHIPLGSHHGVEVAPGNSLHYLWMDFFFDKSGISWITENHHEEQG